MKITLRMPRPSRLVGVVFLVSAKLLSQYVDFKDQLMYLPGLSFRRCLIHSVSKFEISSFPNSWVSSVSLILRAGRTRTMGIRWRARLRGWSSMRRGKGHLHKKWRNQITKVRCCSSYMFNFRSRGWQFCLERSHQWGDNDCALRRWRFKCPKKDFQTSNDSRHNRSGADLGLFNSPSTFSPSAVKSFCQWQNTLEVTPSYKLPSLSHYCSCSFCLCIRARIVKTNSVL